MLSRRSNTSFMKVASILGLATVAAREDGTIEIAALTDPSGQPKRWGEVAPMTFRDVNGQDTLIFKPDENGVMQLILPYPFMVFQRVGLWENSGIILPVVGLSLLIMLVTMLVAPVAWLVRRHYGIKLDLTPIERWLRIGVWIVFALDLIFIAAFVGFVTYASSHIELLSDSGNKWIYLIQTIGIIGAVGTLVVLYNAIKSWMGNRRIWSKLRATLFVLACLGFLWFALVSNLLVFSSNY